MNSLFTMSRIKKNQFKQIKLEVISISLLLDILNIVADNLIEETNCYLSECEIDNTIPKSFKNILNLVNDFVNSYKNQLSSFDDIFLYKLTK